MILIARGSARPRQLLRRWAAPFRKTVSVSSGYALQDQAANIGLE